MLNLLNNLLINQWSTKVYYSNYFYKCAPSYCTYVRTDQIYFWDAVTLFISLYGGLIIILRLITPFLINISLKLREHFRNTNNNISSISIHFLFKIVIFLFAFLNFNSSSSRSTNVYSMDWKSKFI